MAIPPKPAPKPAPAPEPVMEEEEDEDDDGIPRQQPITFEELLEQFGSATKKPTGPVRVRAERERKFGIDDEFIPATDTPKQKEEELKQLYKEQDQLKHSLMTADDLLDKRDDIYKIKVKGSNRYAALLNNPQSLRDAMIMKEVLDRKYFDW